MEREFEAALVRRLRAGDAAAFDEVFGAYNRRLLSFLARMTKNRSAAEDLVEETWLRLVSARQDLHEDTRLGPWLFTVARNLYVSFCRSRAREHSSTPDLILLWPGGLPQTPYEVASGNEFEQRLEEAIAALPPMYREALLLVGVEQLRAVDAAEVCGISAESLRQRLRRARAFLSRFLAGADARREPVRRRVSP
jgi:RNA polymerase sigma-70 factor (ECF subfamily)